MRFLTVQPRWLMYLMIFVIGCSRVSAASLETPPLHPAAIAKPASVMPQHAHAAQAVSHILTMDCHRGGMPPPDDQAAQQATCHQEEGEKSGHLPSCADCSASHCQTLNSGVLQPAFAGITTDMALPHFSCSYWSDQGQHLTGYWQEILRPPRT